MVQVQPEVPQLMPFGHTIQSCVDVFVAQFTGVTCTGCFVPSISQGDESCRHDTCNWEDTWEDASADDHQRKPGCVVVHDLEPDWAMHRRK